MTANFRSDNETPVAPQIWAALEEANHGPAWAYQNDQWSARLDDAFSELFETRTTVLPMVTGTAANSIALACMTPPWGSVFCHDWAHILRDEGGAPEFFGNGLRLTPVEGANGKIAVDDFPAAIKGIEGRGVHSYKPAALALSQSTESGTVYHPDELQGLCEIAHDQGMGTQMDGARFANAIASLGCTPAESSWKAGVQWLSFGAGKNGCVAAEALLIFDNTELVEAAERMRKRSGHLLSKMRYVSAQLLAYIDDGVWLKLASHANEQAGKFARVVRQHDTARLEFPADTNMVFVNWTPGEFEKLEQSGIQFQRWPGRGDLARFTFSFSTTDAETDALITAFEG